MEHEIHARTKAVRALNHQALAASTTISGPAIDTKDFESIEFFPQTGTVTAAGSGCSFRLQESETGAFGGEENVVAAAEVLGGTPTIDNNADDNVVYRMGYVGKKRYVRLQAVSLATFSGDVSAIAVLSDPKNAPVADQNT